MASTANVMPPGREHAAAYRALEDGRELVLYRMLFTWRLCLGDQGSMTYHRHWCYPVSELPAVMDVIESWDGNGDPPGPVIKSDRE